MAEFVSRTVIGPASVSDGDVGRHGRLRVLHVVATGTRRGAETFAADLISALDAEQRVAVLRADRVELDFGAPVTVLSSGRWRVPLTRVDVNAVRVLRRLLRRTKPDVIQVHGGEALKTVVASGADARRIVFRAIGLTHRRATRGISRPTYAWLFRRPARVVAVAEAVRRELMTVFAVPGDRVITIPNGVDARRLRPHRTREQVRAEFGLESDARVILALGALTWEKDPLRSLRLVLPVVREIPRAAYLVAGDGPLREALAAEISSAGASDRVRLLGWRSDVGDLLAAADLVLFASRSDGMEGMPAALIEAGMAGRAVAGFDVAGASEVVVHGETGFLVQPGNDAALRSAVERLVRDPAEAAAMGRAAAERCSERFEIATVAVRYAAVYAEVCRCGGS